MCRIFGTEKAFSSLAVNYERRFFGENAASSEFPLLKDLLLARSIFIRGDYILLLANVLQVVSLILEVLEAGQSKKRGSEKLDLPGFVFPSPPAADRFVSSSTAVLLLFQLVLALLFYPFCAPRPSETRVWDKRSARLRTRPLLVYFTDE